MGEGVPRFYLRWVQSAEACGGLVGEKRASASEQSAGGSPALAATGWKFGGDAEHRMALIKCPELAPGIFAVVGAI